MKKISIALALMITAMCSYAQSNFSRTKSKPEYSSMQYTGELGINAGLTSFVGDLGGTGGKGQAFAKDVNGVSMRPHIGISYAYYPLSFLKVMGTLNYTTITAADSVIKSRYNQSLGRAQRNLSFRSRLQEFSVSGELYPLQLISRSQRETVLKPFIGAGVGVFHFNPKSELNGEWVELHPLRLEGQGFSEYPDSKEYSLYQFYIPINLGFKCRVDDNVSLGFQATFRKTFSDNLDDVSDHAYVDPTLFDKYLSADQAVLAKQLYYRGDPSKPISPGLSRSGNATLDSYTTLAVTFAYNLGTKEERGERVGYKVIRVKRTRAERIQEKEDRRERRADRKAQRVSDRVIKVKRYRKR